ncbi:hypothetical protein BZB76_2598 [Actinomadura pelletieri DSM 43383]|uniref:Uncharacterized protein n=1 Tax=Actinomadura pelletieri DSM 43383 TaxID=1120940 RepID=A0A495QUP7_9ACTN|nr:hypothetical protein [Actinomadura pelletieri]RKS77220.1 hypothetical protein BZB76_2598 [Actinomadura pelletieri DSM 43383]
MATMERGNTQRTRGHPQDESNATESEEAREHHHQSPVKERPEEGTVAALLDDPKTRRLL